MNILPVTQASNECLLYLFSDFYTLNYVPRKFTCWSSSYTIGLGQVMTVRPSWWVSALIRWNTEFALSPPCQDTVRRSSASQQESSHQNLTVLVPWSQTSSIQSCEKINFCCLHTKSMVFCCAAQSKKLTVFIYYSTLALPVIKNRDSSQARTRVIVKTHVML